MRNNYVASLVVATSVAVGGFGIYLASVVENLANTNATKIEKVEEA